MFGAVRKLWVFVDFFRALRNMLWPESFCRRGWHLPTRSTHKAFNGEVFDFEICQGCLAGRKFLPWVRDREVISE
jgi:hypothetical protein